MNDKTIFTYENAIGKLVFKYDSPFWITSVDGMSSVDVDISQSSSPGQAGATITSQRVQPSAFTMDGVIFDPVSLNRETLIRVMAPLTPATLTIEQNGQSWYKDVIPQKTPEISPGVGVQNFQVQLLAAYPYWRSTNSIVTQISGLTALFKFPHYTGGSWWISKYDDSYFNTITNKGNVPIEFRVTMIARSPLDNPEIYHMDTGKKLSIRKHMVAGESIIISTIYGQRGVTCISPDGEITNGFKYLTVDSDLSMAIIPGANLLRSDAETNREGLSVRVTAPEGEKSGV